MLRRLFISCIFTALTLSAGTVRSDIVTFYFGGTLATVDPELSSVFSVGNSFFGTLTFNSTTTDSDTANPARGWYRPSPAFAVNINGFAFSDPGGGTGDIIVADNLHGGLSSFDGFYGFGADALTGPSVGSVAPQYWEFSTEDWDSAMYTSDALPLTPPPLSLLEFAEIRIGYVYNNPYVISELSGNLNYLSLAPVPEPEIYAMMGLGLGLLGWVGRRRKLQATA